MAFLKRTASGSAEERQPNGLGVMLTFLCGGLMIAMGLSLTVYGFSALLGGGGRSTDLLFHMGPKLWGAIHTVGGITLFIAGCNIFVGRYWAQMVGIGCSCLAILGGLLSIETYPVWGIGLIVLNLGIIWALAITATT